MALSFYLDEQMAVSDQIDVCFDIHLMLVFVPVAECFNILWGERREVMQA